MTAPKDETVSRYSGMRFDSFTNLPRYASRPSPDETEAFTQTVDSPHVVPSLETKSWSKNPSVAAKNLLTTKEAAAFCGYRSNAGLRKAAYQGLVKSAG